MEIRYGSAVLVEKGEQLLMVKSAKKAVYGMWVIPGGKVEDGESVQQAGKREIKEETGLEVEVADVLCEEEIVKPDEHRVIKFSRGVYKSGEIAVSDELLEARFVGRDEIAAFDDEGLLTPTMVRVLGQTGWLDKQKERA